jgi:AraC-like DNA-binding protein
MFSHPIRPNGLQTLEHIRESTGMVAPGHLRSSADAEDHLRGQSPPNGATEPPRRTVLAFEPQDPPVPKTFAPGSLMAWQADRVLAHIEMQLETSLRAQELAALTRLSSSHFCHAFKVSFGVSPHAYVLRRRVERAKRLMVSAEAAPLADIALSCGLADQAHLSRVFRKLVGESPSAWRRKYRSQPSAQQGQALYEIHASHGRGEEEVIRAGAVTVCVASYTSANDG